MLKSPVWIPKPEIFYAHISPIETEKIKRVDVGIDPDKSPFLTIHQFHLTYSAIHDRISSLIA